MSSYFPVCSCLRHSSSNIFGTHAMVFCSSAVSASENGASLEHNSNASCAVPTIRCVFLSATQLHGCRVYVDVCTSTVTLE